MAQKLANVFEISLVEWIYTFLKYLEKRDSRVWHVLPICFSTYHDQVGMTAKKQSNNDHRDELYYDTRSSTPLVYAQPDWTFLLAATHSC